jgi:hypothetical protein
MKKVMVSAIAISSPNVGPECGDQVFDDVVEIAPKCRNERICERDLG